LTFDGGILIISVGNTGQSSGRGEVVKAHCVPQGDVSVYDWSMLRRVGLSSGIVGAAGCLYASVVRTLVPGVARNLCNTAATRTRQRIALRRMPDDSGEAY